MSTENTPVEYIHYLERRNFVLEHPIGRGASGTVFRAIQKGLGRPVAIKIFDNPHVLSDPRARSRFEHEAKLLARIHHPSIPIVITDGKIPMGNSSVVPYAVLQYIDGKTLNTIIAERKQPEASVSAAIMIDILSALATVHSNAIVHRDVKPSNIMVTAAGHAYLIDFSIGVSLRYAPGLTRVTGNANQPGTPQYMAPEQLANAEPDPAADIFSVGLVLFELCGGIVPANPISDVHDLRMDRVPAEVQPIILKACQADPQKRYKDATQFADELRRLFKSGPRMMLPRMALCVNHLCTGAKWDEVRGPNGYSHVYAGPRIVHDCSKPRCNQCGSAFVFPCAKCGEPFDEDGQYCGSCGTQYYSVPRCVECNGRLTYLEIKTNAMLEGCYDCKASRNDIPF